MIQPTKAFQRKILEHYKKNGRDLPWRHTTNPYFILLSEVMLQQTQVERGKTYYVRWIAKWPNIENLAAATREEVLKEWMGLGYNNRAINLHKAAQKIVSDFKGDVLTAMEHFKEVPGIGPYTSAAVRIFSANENIVTVDTNIRRILIHEFNLDDKVSDKELHDLALKCLPKGKSREWHNGLMDYGALLLTSKKTGIRPKTTQSRFEGSDRQVRARILRYLLKHKNASMEDIRWVGGLIEEERLERILGKMVKEGVLMVDSNFYSIMV